jgi:uracil-DNA glycosylase family 4
MTLEELQAKILSCRYCAQKFGFEPRPFVWGNSSAKIVQISQAPSLSVHKSGKPFDDVSGKKLIYKWYNISEKQFYDKNLFYITAISHCFPGKNSKGNDRKPPLICAKKWLEQELQLVDNKLYILIGSVAAKYFFPNVKFDELVYNENLTLRDKPAIVLPHPSPANRFWFVRHPDFEQIILPRVRQKLRQMIETIAND